MTGQKKTAFLVDFDYTLFNTQLLKDHYSESFAEQYGRNKTALLHSTWQEVDREYGFANVTVVAEKLAKTLKVSENGKTLIKRVLTPNKMGQYLFPHAIKLLKNLKQKGTVYIFSKGDVGYQSTKIRLSGVEAVVGKDNVFLYERKGKEIENILSKLKNEGFEEIYAIDDRLDILQKFHDLDPQIKCVWVNPPEAPAREYANPDTNFLTYRVTDLSDLLNRSF